jgi:hypothetical protein
MRPLILFLIPAFACPLMQAADGDSAESIVGAVYAAISGEAGARDWGRFRSLFAEGARLIPVRMTPEGGAPRVMSVDEYAKQAGANFDKTAFYESEISRRVETFGNIAHVFSTYESRRAPSGKPFARGINSFQLVKTGKEWKVMTILWDTEREQNPIPEKYLTPATGSKVADAGHFTPGVPHPRR